jgi:hypothetical protein
VNYIIFSDFSVVLNHNEPGPKGPMPHGKGLNSKRKMAEPPVYKDGFFELSFDPS